MDRSGTTTTETHATSSGARLRDALRRRGCIAAGQAGRACAGAALRSWLGGRLHEPPTAPSRRPIAC